MQNQMLELRELTAQRGFVLPLPPEPLIQVKNGHIADSVNGKLTLYVWGMLEVT